MRNPFRKSSKPRGLADWTFHHNDQDPQHHDQHTVAPVSAPMAAAHNPSSMPLVPAGYPTGSNHGFGYDNNLPAIEPAIVYPYASQQAPAQEVVWEFNAGNNKNVKGKQKGGHIKVGNGSNGDLPMTIPQKGRIVFSNGNNVNEGELQETSSVEFANIHA